MINWNQKFSIAIPDMDEQHKLWIDIINELYLSVISSSPSDALKQNLIHAVDYTVFHFKEEEALMQNVGYPDYHRHMISHYNFVKRIKKLKDGVSAGQLVLHAEVMKDLINWLFNHIMGLDKKYADYITLESVKPET